MTTPKSVEQIMQDFATLPIHVATGAEERRCRLFIRQAIASAILHAAEEMSKKPYIDFHAYDAKDGKNMQEYMEGINVAIQGLRAYAEEVMKG